ncbi:hypothetical protein VTK26DRAFT_8908 [Humicola hyalothermophila]
MRLLNDLRERHLDGRLAKWWPKIRPWLPPVNFITLHYAYFILTCLFFALIFWGCRTSSSLSVGFLDSIFLTMSALSSTGLTTVNLSELSIGQQVVLFIAMMAGSPILVSLWTVLCRRHVFEKRFREIVKAERMRKLRMGSSMKLASGVADLLSLARLRSLTKAKSQGNDTPLPGLGTRIADPPPTAETARAHPEVPERQDRDIEAAGLAPILERAPPKSPGERSGRSVAFAELPRPPTRANERGGVAIRNFLEEKRKHVGRNGEFFNLTLKEREYLGGVEYRAIEAIVVTVAMYFVLWQLLGAIALGACIAVNSPEIPVANRQNAWWTGIFLAISAFNNAGMSLLDAGMTAFQSGHYFVVIVVSFLTLAGSRASPIFLRFIFWVLSRLLKYSTQDEHYAVWKETFDFILRYPRRVYINMFPARPTWVLALWLGGFLVVDWIMFFLLNIGNEAIEKIPPGPLVLDGFFQSISLLSGGFAIISVSAVYHGLQVLWLVKMYASAYPTSITVRGSNVYEERSLGIYAGDEPEEEKVPKAPTGLLSPAGMRVPSSPMSATSRMSRFSRVSQRGIDRIVGFGREGTALVGRQIQRRMTGFQGIGVAPAVAKKFNAPQNSQTWDNSDTASARSTAEAASGAPNLVSHHVRSQLSHDVWWIAFAFFLIAIIETSNTLADPATFGLFNILFEVVSAYANNGLSLGLPKAAFSFSGGWRPGSKFILVLVMLRGRHRDLPVALDRAVKLPSLDLDEQEEDDAEIRRTISRTPMIQSISRF